MAEPEVSELWAWTTTWPGAAIVGIAGLDVILYWAVLRYYARPRKWNE